MAGLAGRDRQAGPRHQPDALAAPEGDARPRRAAPHHAAHQRAMRHVRVVARILDHAGHRLAFAGLGHRQREGNAVAAGQADLDRIGEALPISAEQAALAAAVAQAPVVQPRLSAVLSVSCASAPLSVTMRRSNRATVDPRNGSSSAPKPGQGPSPSACPSAGRCGASGHERARIIVGAPRSGSGKTSITIGLLRALDGAASRRAARNSDRLQSIPAPCRSHRPARRQSRQLGHGARPHRGPVGAASRDADLMVVESAMGLFDGIAAEPGVPARPPISRAATACRCCWLLDVLRPVAGRRRPSPRDLRPTDPNVEISASFSTRLQRTPPKTVTAKAIEATGLAGGRCRHARCLRHAARAPSRPRTGERTRGLSAHLDRLADLMERSLDIDRIIGLMRPSTQRHLPPHSPCRRLASASR